MSAPHRHTAAPARADTQRLQRELAELERRQGHEDGPARAALQELDDLLAAPVQAPRHYAGGGCAGGGARRDPHEPDWAEEARVEARMHELHLRLHQLQKRAEGLDGPGRELVAAQLGDWGFSVPPAPTEEPEGSRFGCGYRN